MLRRHVCVSCRLLPGGICQAKQSAEGSAAVWAACQAALDFAAGWIGELILQPSQGKACKVAAHEQQLAYCEIPPEHTCKLMRPGRNRT